MNYEEQILALKKRIEVLEKAENKRIKKREREIIFKIIKFIVIVGVIIFGINYVYKNYVIPYKEKIDKFEEKVDAVEDFVSDNLDIIEEKVDAVEDFVSDNLDIIDKINPFS